LLLLILEIYFSLYLFLSLSLSLVAFHLAVRTLPMSAPTAAAAGMLIRLICVLIGLIGPSGPWLQLSLCSKYRLVLLPYTHGCFLLFLLCYSAAGLPAFLLGFQSRPCISACDHFPYSEVCLLSTYCVE